MGSPQPAGVPYSRIWLDNPVDPNPVPKLPSWAGVAGVADWPGAGPGT